MRAKHKKYSPATNIRVCAEVAQAHRPELAVGGEGIYYNSATISPLLSPKQPSHISTLHPDPYLCRQEALLSTEEL
jgi:hypothetical protein